MGSHVGWDRTASGVGTINKACNFSNVACEQWHKQLQDNENPPTQAGSTSSDHSRARAHCKSGRTIKNHQQQRLLSSARPTRGLCSLVYKSIECKLQQYFRSRRNLHIISFVHPIYLLPEHVHHVCVCLSECVRLDNKAEQVAYRKCRIVNLSILHAKSQLLSANKD